MKTNKINLLKTIFSFCLLIVCSLNVNAQLGKKPRTQPSVSVWATKVKPIITSPVSGSTINGPFVMVGKGEPNSYINLYVTPQYRLPANNTGKPTLVVSSPQHKQQHFSVKADEKGIWQSPLIEVRFDSKTTDRRIFAFLTQTWGAERYETKNVEYLASPKLTMIMETVKMPAKPKEEEKSSGQPQTDPGIRKGEGDNSAMPFTISSPTNNKFVDRNSFRVSGTAPDGASVRVEIRYSGYRTKSNLTLQNFGSWVLPAVNKTTTTVNNAIWASYTVRSTRVLNISNAMWLTDEIDFIKRIDGYACWANTYTITASLVDENGRLVRPIKTYVTRMKTKAL